MPVNSLLVWPLYLSGDQVLQDKDIHQCVQQEVLEKEDEEDFSTMYLTATWYDLYSIYIYIYIYTCIKL